MQESVFALVRDRRAACALNESLSLERVENVRRFVRRPAARDAADPEHLPVHGCVVQECLLRGRQPVEARCDDPLHRLGQCGIAGAPALRDHLRVLLGIERIAAGASDQLSLIVGLEQGAWQHGPEQAGRLVIRERRERQRRRIQLPATPARVLLEELGAGGAHDEHRHRSRPLREVIDEGDETVVGPVEVLEDENEGAPLGHRLEEPAPRRERLRPRLVAERDVGPGADQRTKLLFQRFRLGRFRDEIRNSGGQLLVGDLVAVGLQHARLRLDHLRQRPERHAFSVGEGSALPPEREDATLLDGLHQLAHEARLADSRHAHERGELRRRFLAHAYEQLAKHGELAVAPDERRPRRDRLLADPGACLDHLPHGDGQRLPLRVDRAGLAVVDRALASPGTLFPRRRFRSSAPRSASAPPCSRRRPPPCPLPTPAAHPG